MSWQDIMRRVLPPVERPPEFRDSRPDVTSPYGDTKDRPRGSSNPHGGVDFNYRVGKHARLFNLSHPVLRAPVRGIVTNAGEGTVGRIAIRDANGFSHEILHTYTRHVAVGDPVVAGQLIGTMGETGVKQSDPNVRADHVHYQLKDPAGNKVNPTDYWDRQGSVDLNPAPPAYLGEYQQYSQIPNQALSPDRSNSFDNRFGNWPSAPVVSASDATMSAAPSSPAKFDNNVRILSRRVAGKPGATFFDKMNPAVPFVPPNEVLAPGRPASFADRFGDWTSLPAGGIPRIPYQPVPPPEDGSSTRGDAGNIRVVSSRFMPRDGAGNASLAPTGFSSQSAPLSQSGQPLGLFTGEPMPKNPLAPSIWDFLDNSRSPRDDGEDWIRLLVRR